MASPPPPVAAPGPSAPPSELTLKVWEGLQKLLSRPPSPQTLALALRLLSKWRVELLSNTFDRKSGPKVIGGPFEGMDYSVRASEGSRSARLLGAYEASLHPVIEAIIAKAPDLVIDVGSAEGYYAVGLALRLPAARVLARDASAAAQALCHDHIRANGVEGRVEVGGLFSHSDFAVCSTTRSVVICDIEGAEDALLDPVAAPGLRDADILVECHPSLVPTPNLTDRIAARFQDSHTITRIGRKLDDSAMPAWMEDLSDLDRLLALWEWRSSPTPWLWMERK